MRIVCKDNKRDECIEFYCEDVHYDLIRTYRNCLPYSLFERGTIDEIVEGTSQVFKRQSIMYTRLLEKDNDRPH